jgi:hypothetical protein
MKKTKLYELTPECDDRFDPRWTPMSSPGAFLAILKVCRGREQPVVSESYLLAMQTVYQRGKRIAI